MLFSTQSLRPLRLGSEPTLKTIHRRCAEDFKCGRRSQIEKPQPKFRQHSRILDSAAYDDETARADASLAKAAPYNQSTEFELVSLCYFL